MDRTVCGACGCWLGDDLHAEIKRLRAERDALRDALIECESYSRCTCGHPYCKRCRATREANAALQLGGGK